MRTVHPIWRRFIAPAVLVVAAGCGGILQDPAQEQPEPPAVESPAPGIYTLQVMETTDIHGHVVSNDGSYTHYRMAYIADKANDIRGHGEDYDASRLLLLDGGDLYQGASISNLQDGWPVCASLDVMDYDAVALGNHEFDWGIAKTVDSDATVPDYSRGGTLLSNLVPVVCANLYQDGSRVSWTRDYVVVEKTAVNASGAAVPVKIGIIGFAVDYSGSIMNSKFSGLGYSIREDYSIANDLAASLEASGECDATVLLIHGAAETSAEKLGRGSAIDLVLGGHSHQTRTGYSSAKMPYIQGGRYGEHYAGATMRFRVDGDGGISFESVSGLITPAVDSNRDRHESSGQNSEDLDAAVLALSDEAIGAVAEQMDDVIGYIGVGATSYYISGSGERAAVISNWMCDILRRIGDADVAFVNAGGIRTTFPLGGQNRRDITVANVYEMFPFSNTTYIYDISYADLLELLEYAMTSGGQSLFSRMTGIDCWFSGYSVLSLRKDGQVIWQQGGWTEDWASRRLRLAVSEYLATSPRQDYYTGIENPLLEWNGTPRLLSSDLVDNENAVRVLKAEAADSGGRLYIDTDPHFILDN